MQTQGCAVCQQLKSAVEPLEEKTKFRELGVSLSLPKEARKQAFQESSSLKSSE